MEKFGDFREQYLLERNALYTLYKNLDDESLAVFPARCCSRRVARSRVAKLASACPRPSQIQETTPTADECRQVDAGGRLRHRPVRGEPARSCEGARAGAVDPSQCPTASSSPSSAIPTSPPTRPSPTCAGYENIAGTLGCSISRQRAASLIITGDPIGARMAGPAIRASNMARVLADENDVRLDQHDHRGADRRRL